MSTFTKPFYFVCFCLGILFGSNTNAAYSKAGMGFGTHLGSHIGFGRVGTQNQSTQNRTVGSLDFQVMPAFRYDSLMAGLMIEYRFLGQLDQPADVGYTDLSGDEFLTGLGIAYHFSDYKLLFTYMLKSNYSVSNPGSSVTNQSYSGGGGFGILFGLEIAPSWYFDFLFSQLSYSTITNSDVESEINSNPLSHWNFGFGVSYSY